MYGTIDLLNQDLYRIYTLPEKLNQLNTIQIFFIIFKYIIISSSFRVIFFYRITNYFYLKNSSIWLNIFIAISLVITKIQIPPSAKINGGLFIPHTDCVIIHHKSIIGKNVTILQGVTIGGNIGKKKYINKSLRSSPVIGDNVLIGAGAKILGPIKIGKNSMIGANAVVTKDVPKNSVAVGIPAEVIKKVKTNYIDIESELKIFNSKI